MTCGPRAAAASWRHRGRSGAPGACAHSEQAPAVDFLALAAGYGHCNDITARRSMTPGRE